jgi:hypothetical protein
MLSTYHAGVGCQNPELRGRIRLNINSGGEADLARQTPSMTETTLSVQGVDLFP